MSNTIEGTHHKIVEKIDLLIEAAELIGADKVKRELGEILAEYNLAVAPIFVSYYDPAEGNDADNTRAFYRVITADQIIGRITSAATALRQIRPGAGQAAARLIEQSAALIIRVHPERCDYRTCKCGERMMPIPELSELRCECGRTKTIIGTVFRDEQFYSQECHKNKHGEYVNSRHYKFWIERLQALETKVFPAPVLTKVERVIARDRIAPYELTCELMRKILKDPAVGHTEYNEHASLLIKMFGGPVPPRLDFHESRQIAIRFNKMMVLYDLVNPDGGNKPYYPYFIYKIIERMFRADPVKIKLLNYIHLQARDTVVKNDIEFRRMCERPENDDPDIVYLPTDPCRRY